MGLGMRRLHMYTVCIELVPGQIRITIAYISKAGTDVVWLFLLLLLILIVVVVVPALAARGRGTEGNTVVISWRLIKGEGKTGESKVNRQSH